MKLINKLDVFIPHEELIQALDSKDSQSVVRERVLELLRKAFALGREAERLEKIEEIAVKEGGIVNLVRSK